MSKYQIDDFEVGDVVSELEDPSIGDELLVVDRIIKDGMMSRLDCITAMLFPGDVAVIYKKYRKGEKMTRKEYK